MSTYTIKKKKNDKYVEVFRGNMQLIQRSKDNFLRWKSQNKITIDDITGFTVAEACDNLKTMLG
jgi:hypothetical protein